MKFQPVAPDIAAKVLASPKPTSEIAIELGISRSTAWRIRKAAPVTTHFITTNKASIARRKARAEAAKEGAANRISALDRVRRMSEIDRGYAKANAEPRTNRCCGKCRTPYNCGNKGCQCHA